VKLETVTLNTDTLSITDTGRRYETIVTKLYAKLMHYNKK